MRTTLPPKHNFTASFNFDWELMTKKREIESLRPKEICPKRNRSFHTSQNESDKSFHNRSFEKSFHQENDRASSRLQTEFGQLKQIIQKKRDEIEKQQRSQNYKINDSVSHKESIKSQQSLNTKKNYDTPQFNYYQTFKPLFNQLNTLYESSNQKEKKKLFTLFDSIDQDSTKGQEPEQMVSLIEQLFKEFVLPTFEQQQTPQRQQETNRQENYIDIQFTTPFEFYQKIKTQESGYFEYLIYNKSTNSDSIQHFNISKKESFKLYKCQNQNIIDLNTIKYCIQQNKITEWQQFNIFCINSEFKCFIFILNNQLSYCKYLMQYSSLNVKQLEFKCKMFINIIKNIEIKFEQRIKKQILMKIQLFNKQIKQLQKFYLKWSFRQIKQQFYFQPSNSNYLSKLILQAARQVKKDEKNNIEKLINILQKYSHKLKTSTFTSLNGNDDLLIMLQALQSESSLENYLQQVTTLLNNKLILSILNLELQSLTSFIPQYGLVQEYFDQIGDLQEFDTLYNLTLNINSEINPEFENRHIWKVTNEIFIITSSNMESQYLCKIALILTNGIQTLRQRYLEFFRFIRLKLEQFIYKIKIQAFNKLKYNRIFQIEQQNQQQHLIYQYEIEMQNLQVQNALKQKCLSSALISNILSKFENDLQIKCQAFHLWQIISKNQRHQNQRFETGGFLLTSALLTISKAQLDLAFREIAFTNKNITLPTSPVIKQTKRSQHTREPTKRSQEELEQSVLWDVHQMKIHTPNGQSLSPMTTHTMNASFLIENESLYQYHSQRCTQKQKKQQKQRHASDQDQENVPSQNKIYSQRTKDFVRKISQPKQHRKLNSTQPGSSFSFYNGEY